ncbi:hypothetical protein [Mycoplasma sp. VS42A]|uniref:hypothetical protein n=1 Tax=unclassified Mycoplasma TaxID=2683645 RepID=UPI003A89A369
MFSSIKSKWGVILVSAIILLIINLIPIGIGQWPFGNSTSCKTWLILYIITKILCGAYFIGFVVYYVIKPKPFANSGIMIIVILSVLAAQLIPLIGRVWWYAFGETKLEVLWYVIYLLVAFTLIFIPIGLYFKVNNKMLERDKIAEPEDIPVRKEVADEDGFSNMRKRD